jgi:chromosome partition protein MukF
MVIFDDPHAARPMMSVAEAVARALVSEFSLQVVKEDAAFICGVQAHLDITRQPSLEESELELIFHVVDEAAIGGTASNHRAGIAIARLRKQGLLERADARGMASYGSYTLSTLANKIRDELFERESLTRRSLQVMMKRVIGDLATVLHAAQSRGGLHNWESEVIDPLRYLVAEVIRAIGHRQKGLETEQREIRATIEKLLKSDDWKHSVQMCHSLLDSTGSTLEELHTILLQEMGSAQNLLSEIGDAAEHQGQDAAFDMVLRLQLQIDSIATWSKTFHATWSEYYTKAHEFIRFAIRIDPNRKLSQRLRESIKNYADQPWMLRTLQAPRFRHLREHDDPPANRALVRVSVRPHREAEDYSAQRQQLEQSMLAALEQELRRAGTVVLSVFLQPYLETLDDDDLYFAVGLLHSWLMRNTKLLPLREHDWTPLRCTVEIQEICAHVLLTTAAGALSTNQGNTNQEKTNQGVI